jgi:hypothetical protein
MASSFQVENQVSPAELIQLLVGGETRTLSRADSEMGEKGHLDPGILPFQSSQAPVRGYFGTSLQQDYLAEKRL